MSKNKKVVGLDDVIRALAIREGGGSWGQVIDATGFNGATLRPHITRHLQSKERLGRPATEKGDRTDSPYAMVQSVELTTASILSARKRGMAWYSISLALGVSEAKVRSLGGAESSARVYAKSADRAAAIEAATAAAKKAAKAAKAKARRDAKKAEKAAATAAATAAIETVGDLAIEEATA